MSIDDKYKPKGEMVAPTNPLDMNDEIDRRNKASVIDKLEWICAKAAEAFGRDPRAGGFSFVGRPKVIEQILRDIPTSARNLGKAIVFGDDADIAFRWRVPGRAELPFRVRHATKGDDLWLVPDEIALRRGAHDLLDRRTASEIRMGALCDAIVVVEAN